MTFFASVPDECPECDHVLDTEVNLKMNTNDPVEGVATVFCPHCGWTDSYTVGDDDAETDGGRERGHLWTDDDFTL